MSMRCAQREHPECPEHQRNQAGRERDRRIAVAHHDCGDGQEREQTEEEQPGQG